MSGTKRRVRVSKEEQQYTRHNGKPLYSIHTLDWKLFMWFASLENIENLISLFIVVWDAEIQYNSSEFSYDIDKLIKNLNFLKEFNKEAYHKTLKDYRKGHLNKD